MKNNQTRIALAILFSVAGLALSGYLSWYNLWGPGCAKNLAPVTNPVFTCSGGGQPVKLFGQPTCVYGFAMFLSIFVLNLILLKRFRAGVRRALLGLVTVGLLFAASLSVYELWIRDVPVSGLPACVYGFFLYLGMLISLWGTKPTEPTPYQPQTN